MEAQIKEWAKLAKAALKEQKYDDCVGYCRSIIKSDPKNYTAWIFQGAALQKQDKHNQAGDSFKAAIELNPNIEPGWKGIIKLYEESQKKPHPDLLIQAYKFLASSSEKDEDKEKFIENSLKAINVIMNMEEFKGAMKLLKRFQKSLKPAPMPTAAAIHAVTAYSKTAKIRVEDDDNLYLDALDTLIDDPEKTKYEYYRDFYSLLYKRKEMDRIVEHALSHENKFNAVPYPLEYLLRIYLESSRTEYETQVPTLVQKLHKLNPSNLYGHYAMGKYLFKTRNLFDSINWLKTGLECKFNEEASVILAQAKLAFADFEGAIDAVNDTRKQTKNISAELDQLLFNTETEALLFYNLEAAEKVIREFQLDGEVSEPQQHVARVKLLAKLALLKGDIASLKKVKPHMGGCPEDLQELVAVMIAQKEIPTEVEETLSKNETHLDTLILGGILLWKLNHFSTAVAVFYKIQKLVNRHPLPLMYTARLYQMVGKKEDAAHQAEAAYKMYPSVDNGILLSDLYFELGETEKNIALLEGATKRLKKLKSKWAWYRLGILSLNSPRRVNAATIALQAAVRVDSNDGHLWETLADAYLARGSLQSALKSYNRALELNVDPVYPKYKIGVLYQQLNELPKAVEAFLNVLTNADGTGSSYVPAMVELARTFFLQAKGFISENRDIAAVQAVESAVVWAMKAVRSDDSKILPWKLIGDCTLVLRNCSETMKVKVPSSLIGLEADDGLDSIFLPEFLKVGTSSYYMALKCCQSTNIKGAIADVYHSIGVSLNVRARITANENEKSNLIMKAVRNIKIAITRSKDNPTYWNSLGVAASSVGGRLNRLAQHAFIKSLQLEPNNVTAWFNLGMLHYHHGETMSAHFCFSRAQRIDPDYSYSWIGQGLVAEVMQPKDAVDLFRHTCLLKNYPSMAAVAYTDWICRNLRYKNRDEHYLYTIEKCEGIRTSYDLMSLYCVHRPLDAVGHLYRGLLAGRLGLIRSAKDGFKVCAGLVQDSKSALGKTVRANLAATHLLISELEQARIELHNLSGDDFGYNCLRANLDYKEERLEESETFYRNALERAECDSERAEVYTAMGIVKGRQSQMQEAKTMIFQGWQLDRKQVNGLIAIVAMCLQKEDITDEDANISAAVYQELQSVNEYSVIVDVSLVQAAWHLVQGDFIGGKNCILKLAHTYPWNPQLWNTLAHYLLEADEGENARTLIRKAVTRASGWERTSEVLAAFSFCLEGNFTRALHYAKKAVHSEPFNPGTWTVLLLSLANSNRSDVRRPDALKSIASKAMKLCSEQQPDLHEWLSGFVTSEAS